MIAMTCPRRKRAKHAGGKVDADIIITSIDERPADAPASGPEIENAR
jgi:hypothetical protein